MSALAAPLPPRLRLVSTEDERSPRLSAVTGAPGAELAIAEERSVRAQAPRRPRLRVVPGGAAASVVPMPLGPARRPVAPRRMRPVGLRAGSGSAARAALAAQDADRVLEATPLERLAPTHPSIRARRRRLGEVTATARAVEAPTRQPSPMSVLPRNVRRLLAVGVLALAVVLVAAGGIVASGFRAAPVETTTATVRSGQSLWDIAVAADAGDVNEVMAQIVDLNGLTSSTLQAGQTLIVPAG
ncbi:LysM peptidoglycan-binding domain-containing protein [Actinomyces procaprae]|uniref:LysM peptidoglycan-binding domain-containing protein n=1 Tax=Actinomyces procaprae TaxID=2560010 RepID=UPI001F027A14|nr:LysM peptidoglycan-binding domain-containing protein [Actinomyces procaprae]